MRGARMWVTRGALLALAATAHAGPTTNYPILKQPVTGPASAIEAYAQAFRDRNAAGVGAVLTADYRFHGISDAAQNYTFGNDRTKEMKVVENMLHGFSRDGVVIIPPPAHVSMTVDGVNTGIDPEHADSTEHYRVLTVGRLGFKIERDRQQSMTSAPAMHVIHVVRGDAAVMPDGETADPGRWYIRRWLEDIRGVNAALREKKGQCGDEPTSPAAPAPSATLPPAVPGALGVRPLTNPACSAMRLQLELPGSETARLQVYDTSGRLVNERTLDAPRPGTVSVDAGAGAQILPGVYWVRLEQAQRKPGVRMVVVAR